MLGAARAYVYEALKAAWQTVTQGEFLSLRQKIAIQLATSHAVDSSAKVVQLVHQAGGSSHLSATSATFTWSLSMRSAR